MTFLEMQDEVKRRSTRNQGGLQFDTAIKNAINAAIFRISKEALWRVLRRTSTITTESSYTTGTGAVSVTANSKNFSVTGATFLTDGIEIGRKVKFGTDARVYEIATITSETAGTITRDYDGTTSTTTSYEILPREEYNLPVQASHRIFLWHDDYGYPYRLRYLPEIEFRDLGIEDDQKGTPTHYRMWGEDMAIQQPVSASVMTVSSSSSSDINIPVTVFGTVSGYPDFETITTNASNGTTAVVGSKSFTSIERVTKGAETTGRITVTSNSANVTVATLPVGKQTSGIVYRKIRLYPLPDDVFDIKVLYYKDAFKLVNNNDVHEMGDQFDEAIVLLACTKLEVEQNQQEGSSFYELYKDELRVLKRSNVDKIDWLPTLKRPWATNFGTPFHRNLFYEQLGGNYGPQGGRW